MDQPDPTPFTEQTADYVIVGSGMAGLSTAALLAHQGAKVVLLEAHQLVGGYAQTFTMGEYRFCAEVHYLFGCGEGEVVHRFLSHLGLAEQVPFLRLDPEGYDHVAIGGDRYRLPNGFAKLRERLIRRFPDEADGLRAYFTLLQGTRDELDAMPELPTLWDYLSSPWHFPHLLRHRSATLGEVFDRLQLSPRLRAVLAGQCGDYLLPPRDVSFLLHVALTSAYDRGAHYPKGHVHHLIDTLVAFIRAQPGCAVLTGQPVDRIEVTDGRVSGVHTTTGHLFRAERVISNVDPAGTTALLADPTLAARHHEGTDYAYSCSNLTLYLGLRGMNPADHGFGSFNLWHYPHDDLDRIYDAQNLHDDLSDPWLFVASPTLHSDAPGLAPPGEHTLIVATSCRYAHWRELRDADPHAYRARKVEVRERMLDVLEQRYLPGLRDHLALKVLGTPVTNERFVRAPRGNAYGAALTPNQVSFPRVPFKTEVPGLWQVNATAGYPSMGGTVSSACRLLTELTGVRP
jgi:all-trans-retinol 13,14-reductase